MLLFPSQLQYISVLITQVLRWAHQKWCGIRWHTLSLLKQGGGAESVGLVVWAVLVLIVTRGAPSPLPQVVCNVDHRALPIYRIK